MKFTLGGQFQDQSKKQYIGYYHIIKGRYYTGKRYIKNKSIEIFKIIKTQGELQMYEHAMPFYDFIKSIEVNYDQFQMVKYPIIQKKQIYNIFILYDTLTSKIYDVNEKTFNKYKNHRNFKHYEIKLKNMSTLNNFSYNSYNINKIDNQKVKNYLNLIKTEI